MTKQMMMAMAAMLMVGTLPMVAQTSQTDVVKVAPGQKKTTTIKRNNGATDTVVSEGVSGQTKKKRATHPVARTAKAPVENPLTREVRELQDKQAAQQAQIDALTQANAAKDAQLQAANAAAAQAQQTAQAATAQEQTVSATVQQQADQVQALKSNVTDLQTTNAGLASTISANKTELLDKIESPTSLHYKGVNITPGGFLAFEGVWRERSVNSDVNTPLNSIPFPSANEGHVSELNMSGRQSRVSMLVETRDSPVKLTGYYEVDWLGTGTSSNNNQSNSYVLRQRQIWGQAALKNGFTITGGQMWSLVTEMRKGTDAKSEIQPQTIDAQYTVGYSWTRQPELRLQQRFGDYKTGAFTAAMSLEQAQITNFTANGTNPADYFFGGLGQNGGLYNAAASAAGTPSCTASAATPPVITCTEATSNITTYANNVAPDTIVKFAYDAPMSGKYNTFHAELGGISRFLRDYYYPVTTGGSGGTPVYTYNTSQFLSHTAAAGGVFGSVRGYLMDKAEVGLQGMVGSGVGRYGSAQLADATLRPDETLEPVKNYHGLASVEVHVSPKVDLFTYYGGEYAKRLVYTTAAGNLIGYAPPNLSNAGCYNLPAGPTTTIGNGGSTGSLSATTCGEPTKYIQEGMIGFQWRPITSPKYGKLQYSITYSLIQRQLWAGIGSATTPVSPRAQDSMVHFQMRYYIP